jgi:asparagine synthase (glutamine-hydrolysing)
MAGLVAVARRSGDVPSGRFDRLLGTLDYRGHDGRGTWADAGVALGQQRFWATPRAVGSEPPVEVRDVVVALAGRLDDRRSLTAALPAGTDADDVCDAALLGHAYAEWGVDCLARAVGAFGVVLWDREARRLVAARDKTGIRHLFVGEGDGVVVVASDAATVRAHPAVATSPDERSLAAFLLNRSTADDASFYRGVRRLPAGTRLVADDDGVVVDRYWHPADGPDLRGESDQALRDRLRGAFRAAVDARVRSREVPAVEMSGGLDSTTVAGVASADLGADVRPHSLVFERADDEGLTRGERGRIRDVVDTHDLDAREVVGDGCRPLADPSVYEGPLAESPCLEPIQPAIDRLDEAVAESHRVALTGHGGDAFGGSRFAYADLLRRGRVVSLVRAARADEMPTRRALKWFAAAPAVPSVTRRLTDGDDGPPSWVGPALRDLETPDRTAPEAFWSIHRRRDYKHLTGVRREHKLHVAHRRALRHGVEFRMPFLDARMVETVYAVPPHRLLAGGEYSGLFKAAFGDVLPDSVLAISKGHHFDAVVEVGLRAGGDHLADVLSGTALAERGVVAAGAPGEAVDAFLEGDRSSQLPWRLYSCERWIQKLKN